MNPILASLQRFAILASSRNDLVLAVILVGIIFMMILPLPAEHLWRWSLANRRGVP